MNRDSHKTLLIASLLGLLFMVIRDDSTAMVGFLFKDNQMFLQAWIWFTGKHHAKVIILSLLLYQYIRSLPMFVFLIWEILEMVDFFLTANSVWFHLGLVPVSMNTVGITAFCLALLKEYTDEH